MLRKISRSKYLTVIPAKAGIQESRNDWVCTPWIPAFAGMTIPFPGPHSFTRLPCDIGVPLDLRSLAIEIGHAKLAMPKFFRHGGAKLDKLAFTIPGTTFALTFDLPRVFLPKKKQEIKGPGGIQAGYDRRAARDSTAGYLLRVTLINDVSAY